MAGDGGGLGARPSSAGQKSLDVIDLGGESDGSGRVSKASTKIGDRSVGGAASSAEDEGGASCPKAIVCPTVAAAGPAPTRQHKVEPKRHSLHPPHPYIEKALLRQVRWIESGVFLI